MFAFEVLHFVYVVHCNRTPSFQQLERLAAALKLSPYALADPCLENRHGVMQALFSMEDDFGLQPVEVDGQIMLRIDRQKKTPASGSPEDDLRDWCRVWAELSEGTISREDYDEWRYSYPRVKVEREKKARDERRRNDRGHTAQMRQADCRYAVTTIEGEIV